MTEAQKATARACLEAVESDRMSFPRIVATLPEAVFEGYAVDLRRATATCRPPDGESVELPAHGADIPLAPAVDAARLQDAIAEAWRQVPGHLYKGVCTKAARAGRAGYVLSFSGRRALCVGRTAKTPVEPFPIAGRGAGPH